KRCKILATINPMVDVRFCFKLLATWLGRYPKASMAVWIRFFVSALMYSKRPFKYWETVLLETPAFSATSCMVTRFINHHLLINRFSKSVYYSVMEAHSRFKGSFSFL